MRTCSSAVAAGNHYERVAAVRVALPLPRGSEAVVRGVLWLLGSVLGAVNQARLGTRTPQIVKRKAWDLQLQMTVRSVLLPRIVDVQEVLSLKIWQWSDAGRFALLGLCHRCGPMEIAPQCRLGRCLTSAAACFAAVTGETGTCCQEHPLTGGM